MESELQTTRVVARQIATALNEQEKGPYMLIERTVATLGEEVALDLLHQVEAVEAAGGMMLSDGSRRRTPGGVFFVLVRRLAAADERRRIFQRAWQPRQARPDGQPAPREQPRRPQSPNKLSNDAPTWTWAARAGILEQLEARRGEVKTVRVTIIGRPVQLVEQGKCVVFTMQQTPKLPALPADLPLPPLDQVKATRYSVYVASKQWKKVAEALTDPEDTLIVEGFQFLDRGVQVIYR